MYIAKINTKSNYRNLNGKWLEVKQFLGTMVACSFYSLDGIERTVDFNLSEISSIKKNRV